MASSADLSVHILKHHPGVNVPQCHLFFISRNLPSPSSMSQTLHHVFIISHHLPSPSSMSQMLHVPSIHHSPRPAATPPPPENPVRVWLGRVTLSIVVGIMLGSAATFCALRAATTKTGSVCAGADATSPWWSTGSAGDSVGAGGADQSFGDRLDKALFAARAGEAAAQQGLLVRERS